VIRSPRAATPILVTLGNILALFGPLKGDILSWICAALISYGTWQIYHPAAWIVAGLLGLVYAIGLDHEFVRARE
jgi:hypothetical protein